MLLSMMDKKPDNMIIVQTSSPLGGGQGIIDTIVQQIEDLLFETATVEIEPVVDEGFEGGLSIVAHDIQIIFKDGKPPQLTTMQKVRIDQIINPLVQGSHLVPAKIAIF
jgi:hypothetical protein